MVRDAHDQRHVVLDQNDRDAEIGDAADQLAQRHLVGAHQAGGGLVEQQHARARRERARDLDQPPVDMRQAVRRRRQRAVIADERQQRFGDGAIRGARGAPERIAEPPAPQRDQHIVEHAHLAEQLRGLIGARDAGARDAPGRRAGELRVAEPDAARVGPIEAADHVEHGGLAGAVRPDHAGDASGLRP